MDYVVDNSDLVEFLVAYFDKYPSDLSLTGQSFSESSSFVQ